MKQIDRQKFDELLLSNREGALQGLEDRYGQNIDKIQIGGITYKIFPLRPDSLLTKAALPENCAGLVIGAVDFSGQTIKQSNFSHWYFIGDVNFENAKFENEANFSYASFFSGVNFSHAEFYYESFFGNSRFLSSYKGRQVKENDSLSKTTFTGNPALLSVIRFDKEYEVKFNYAEFRGKAYFNEATFKRSIEFYDAKFWDTVDFNLTIFEQSVCFMLTTFKDRCYLNVKKNGYFVDFRYGEFRGSVFIDGLKLCEDEKKLSFPSKLIVKENGVVDNNSTKENILAVKQICNKMGSFEE